MEQHHLILLAGLVVYFFTVRRLRYRRRDAIKRKHGMHSRSDFSSLTADQAQDVLKDLVEMEFPKLMGFSIVFALFKTYGIPSVSSLLVRTGELAGMETASKRTADTGVLLLEFCLNKPSSDRATQAIARMNFLHSRYLKAGKISNDDMLYTLSVFALEPVRWVNQYEWRQMSDLELCASGTFWKAMGDKMEISFATLPSSESGWTDGLHWLQELRTWSEAYERRAMVPAKTNHDLALAHLDVIFINIPPRLNAIGKYVVSVLVGERLRKAMILPDPPWYYTSAIENFLLLRRLLLRHLALPRLEIQRKQYISFEKEANGRYSSREYLSHPWYVKPTFKRRWGGRAWITWLLGRKLPGDDGNRYNPEGYLIPEVGPAKMAGSGKKEMQSDLERMQLNSPGGCPFSRSMNVKAA
jgi:hypothetical protein